MNLIHNGEEIIAADQSGMVIKLRFERKMTYAQIGKAMGLTRSRVGQILSEKALNGRLHYPELHKPETFLDPDEVLSSKYHLPVSRITAARKNMGERKQYSIRLVNRRRHLCKALFNNGYYPGPNFVDFIKTQLDTFPDKKREMIEGFYLDGKTQGDLSDGNRVYRSFVKRELKERLSFFNLETLVREGVIQHGRDNLEGQ